MSCVTDWWGGRARKCSRLCGAAMPRQFPLHPRDGVLLFHGVVMGVAVGVEREKERSCSSTNCAGILIERAPGVLIAAICPRRIFLRTD